MLLIYYQKNTFYQGGNEHAQDDNKLIFINLTFNRAQSFRDSPQTFDI